MIPARTLLSLFTVPLLELPRGPACRPGREDPRYRASVCRLEPPELGFFDTVEVREFPSGARTFILTRQEDRADPEAGQVAALVDRLHAVYGEDNLKAGAFSEEDGADLENEEWNGRLWTDKNRFELPVQLFMPSRDRLEMVVFDPSSRGAHGEAGQP